MQIKSVYHSFLYLLILSLFACTSDEMVLTVGEGVVNDRHEAYYTDEFTIESETKLASYVKTNNTGVALCGFYHDDYIGDVTTNTVFKVSPNITITSDSKSPFKDDIRFDALAIVMYPNGYIYGDSTQSVNLTVHELIDNYEPIDTFMSPIQDVGVDEDILANISTTPYDTLNTLASVSFIPEFTDSIIIELPDSLGEKWFNSIISFNDNFVKSSSTDDDLKFIENVFKGLIFKGESTSSAVVGFDMPTSSNPDINPGITLRLYYHTNGSRIDKVHDFSIYKPSYQYNQVTADFSSGILKDIERGGEGIPSSETDGLTFVQSGVGLMTNIKIPTLNDLFVFGSSLGNNIVILNLDLDFSVLPYSFYNNGMLLPSALTLDRIKRNKEINKEGLLDFNDQLVSISQTKIDDKEAAFSVPITRYGWDQQALINNEAPDYNTLLLRSTYNWIYAPNINRMVIGDANKKDCEMKVKMYYTIFE